MANSCESCMSGCSASCKDDCAVGCVESCTGSVASITGSACNGACVGKCSSCTGSCSTTCDGSCINGCTGTCYTSCTNGCKDGCNGCSGCTGACQGCSSCTGSCDGSCIQSCSGTCTNSCNQTCLGTCTTTCTGDCTGCTATCSTNCDSHCSNDCIGSCIGTCVGSAYVKAPTTYIGNTTNEVVYRRVDDLNRVLTKADLNDEDQIITVQNDAARRADLSTIMDRIIDRVTVPQYSIKATLDISSVNGETLHIDKTLYAETDAIARLTNGLVVSVTITMDYPGFRYPDRPWSLQLILSDDSITSHNIYTSDGKLAKEQILSESQILLLVFLQNVETEEGTKSGWFLPNLSHTHDGRYYTQDEIDEVVEDIDSELELRTLINTDEMDDLLRRYQEYTGNSDTIGEIELPTITTPTVGETSDVATGQVMDSNDLSDMMFDIYQNI